MDAVVTDAFASWTQWRRDELLANTANGHVGTKLVAETARRQPAGRRWHRRAMLRIAAPAAHRPEGTPLAG